MTVRGKAPLHGKDGNEDMRELGRRLEPTLDELIVALCRDYDRRRDMLRNAVNMTRRQEEDLLYYNNKILSAAEEVVGHAEAEIYVREIGERRGYASTRAAASESTYKRAKAKIKRRIAEALFFTPEE